MDSPEIELISRFSLGELESSGYLAREQSYDLWERLETIVPVGEAAADAAALRKKAEETTGDMRSISHMGLYRIYNTEAGKRALLSPLPRHLAKRHACVWQFDQRNTIPIPW